MNKLDFLEEFIEEIPVGIARNNSIKQEPNYYNNYLLEMLGWEIDEIDTMEKWFAKVYPDEIYRREVIELWTQMVEDTEQKALQYSYPIEVKVTCKDGSIKWCKVRYYRKTHYIYGLFTNITTQKEQHFKLQEKTQEYHALVSSTQDSLVIVNKEGSIISANNAYCQKSGYTLDELYHLSVPDIEAVHDARKIQENIEKAQKFGHTIFETKHRKKNGELWDVEISLSVANTQAGYKFFSLIRDITERKVNEILTSLRIELSNKIHKGSDSLDDLLQYSLNQAEALTKSQIGFFHFVDDDQESVSLQVWSTNTLQNMCFAEGNSTHYPISQAGVWVDCIHQNKSVIYNDYASLPHKKGLPHGHAPLTRFISVPIYKEKKIVAIIGVGNKESDYSHYDTRIVEKIADLTLEYYGHLKAELQVKHLAFHDQLTGLPNRELLADRLQQATAIAKRNNQLVVICYLDLDDFKPVNDTYGHHIGDELLVQVSSRFQEYIRQGDTIARIGGDEFVIVLTGLEVQSQVHHALQRIHDLIVQPFMIQGHRIHISCSIGATLFPQDDNDTDTLLRHADQAMYQAKESTHSEYIIFNPIGNINHERKLKEEFIQALNQSQLILHYQPKINLHSGDVLGFEALLRWEHPQEALLYPSDFLPIITSSSLEIPLGEWVISQAVITLEHWYKQAIPYTLSINISPKHIQQEKFFDFVVAQLAPYPKALGEKLEFEIVETVAIGDTQLVLENIQKCKTLGISFSLDDFGTGYSSLAYFQKLPVDRLKIDQNFVKELLDNSEDLNIVEGILGLSRSLNRPVIAEGVETTEIALMLIYMGCDYGQGYGIAHPMPLDDAMNWALLWRENNGWAKLIEYNQNHTNRDIAIAIYTHSQWVEQMQDFVLHHAKAPNLDEKSCQFSHWYKGIGRTRFGTRESFPFVQAIHHQAHKIANEIYNAMEKQKQSKAIELLGELKSVQKQLIEILLELEKQ
jgi:diguanylate cyclase (GGDEF)-like protein/PAS domain S-box-containing protein